MSRLKLDQWEGRWSFSRGATKATQRTTDRSMTELTQALAEVDGLLAGINYLEKLEPESEETTSHSALNENTNDSFPPNPATASWFGHLAADLPQLSPLGSKGRSQIQPRHLRNILNEKVVNSNAEPPQTPRASQWATIRSLRKASMLHYNQFAKLTAESTNADIRKLRKSYVTAKKLLEMGILTFRQVLHGENPTTLVDIFAFASLSYVISKTLYARGHIDQSDILSGILDWRAAIADQRESSTFDEIAKQLWPEAKEIMHFIPLKRTETSLETAELKRTANGSRCNPSFMPQEARDAGSLGSDEEDIPPLGDPLQCPWSHESAPVLHADTFVMPCLNELENPPGGLQNHVCQLTQETRSLADFTFSDWFNFDSAVQEGFVDPICDQTLAPDIGPQVLNPSRTVYLFHTELPPTDLPSSLSNNSEEPSPADQPSSPTDDSTLHGLLDTTLFQVVFRFMIRQSFLIHLFHSTR